MTVRDNHLQTDVGVYCVWVCVGVWVWVWGVCVCGCVCGVVVCGVCVCARVRVECVECVSTAPWPLSLDEADAQIAALSRPRTPPRFPPFGRPPPPHGRLSVDDFDGYDEDMLVCAWQLM